jgi:acyl carrier protein
MDVRGRVREFLAGEVLTERNRARFRDGDSLVEQGVLDSMSILKLATFLEEEFGIAVEDQDLVPENFETLDAIRDFVVRRREDVSGDWPGAAR